MLTAEALNELNEGNGTNNLRLLDAENMKEEISMKKAEIEDREKMAAMLKDAEDSAFMKTIRAEKAAAILATRTEAAGKIDVLKKDRDEVIPKLLADRDGKEEKFKRARVALDTAGSEFQKARVALSSENQSFDGAISRQERILIESADSRIDETITFFTEKLVWLRSPGRISSNRLGGERNLYTEKITLKAESNVDAVNSALQYCMAAIKALERMKLTPNLDLEKIVEMKAAVPKIDVYTEFTGEKPY